MFTKEESKRLREEFWISFGKSYPHRWLLYDTKIKGLALKFHFGIKNATVSMNIELSALEMRIELWKKLASLKSILIDQYLPQAQFEDSFVLENQKEISTVYVEKINVSIHNKETWRETMVFLNGNMLRLETFFNEYKEIFLS
ncbi:hypothetical protein MNBD_BACTEROID03-2304 [hydrothermal vent metagenome]|uniref:DUF4268 domain-containing protein n=1 Tax=hydrothermal vent metagenome TaxID=652676 RepID=A0A3B0U3I4_9ZZZZ